MAPLSVSSGSSKGPATKAFDDIDAQFLLDDDALHSITKQFLLDFRSGLGEYGHPMAMMYVDPVQHTFSDSHLVAAQLSLQVSLMDQKLGTCPLNSYATERFATKRSCKRSLVETQNQWGRFGAGLLGEQQCFARTPCVVGH